MRQLQMSTLRHQYNFLAFSMHVLGSMNQLCHGFYEFAANQISDSQSVRGVLYDWLQCGWRTPDNRALLCSGETASSIL